MISYLMALALIALPLLAAGIRRKPNAWKNCG